jgi:hypothetical protein
MIAAVMWEEIIGTYTCIWKRERRDRDSESYRRSVMSRTSERRLYGYIRETLMCAKHNPEGIRPSMFQPASKAVRTAARYSFSLRPFSPENSVNDIYLESATIFAKHGGGITNKLLVGGVESANGKRT